MIHKSFLFLAWLLVSTSACTDTPVERLLPSDDAATRQPATEVSVVSEETTSYTIPLPGTVEAAPGHVAQVSAPISGRVASVHAHDGDRVRAGDTLLELESLEYANLVANFAEARAEETYAEQQAARLETLVEEGISPQRMLEKAVADLERARATTQAAMARLRALGLPAGRVQPTALGQSPTNSLLPIVSPIDGIIEFHGVELGQSVLAYSQMLRIVDNSSVLIKGFVPPDDAADLRVGTPVRIVESGGLSRSLETRIAGINPSVDAVSRSVVVNIISTTDAGWPRIGQTVQLIIQAASAEPVLSIPLSAVVYDGASATVYVQQPDGGFTARRISVVRTNPESVIVGSGLAAGEVVAVSNVFSLKALDRLSQYAE